eukprot:gene18012-biopygen2244
MNNTIMVGGFTAQQRAFDHGGRCVQAHPDDLLPVRERLAADSGLADSVRQKVEAVWGQLEIELGKVMAAAAPVIVSDSLGLAKVRRSGLSKILGCRQ